MPQNNTAQKTTQTIKDITHNEYNGKKRKAIPVTSRGGL
jgi:hypothetical protein